MYHVIYIALAFGHFVACRKIKNAIIGNKMKKSSFMLLGVIPRFA